MLWYRIPDIKPQHDIAMYSLFSATWLQQDSDFWFCGRVEHGRNIFCFGECGWLFATPWAESRVSGSGFADVDGIYDEGLGPEKLMFVSMSCVASDFN